MEEAMDEMEIGDMERKLKRDLHYLGYLAAYVSFVGFLLVVCFGGLIVYGNYYTETDPTWPVVRVVFVKVLLGGLLLMMLVGLPAVRRGFSRHAEEEQTEAAFRWSVVYLVSVYFFMLIVSNIPIQSEISLIGKDGSVKTGHLQAKDYWIMKSFTKSFLEITIFFVTTTPFAFCLTLVMADWSKFYDQLTVPLPSPSLAYKFVLKYGEPVTGVNVEKSPVCWGRLVTITYTVCAVSVAFPLAFNLGSLLLATDIIQRYLRLHFQELSIEPFEVLLQGLNITNGNSSGDVVTSSLNAPTVPDSSTWEKAWYFFIKTYGPYIAYCMVLCELSGLMTLGYRTWKNGCKVPAYRALNMATIARVIHAIAIFLNAMDLYEVAMSSDTGVASSTSDPAAFDGGSFVNLRVIEVILFLSCVGALSMRKNLLTGRGTYNKLMRKFQKEAPAT